MCGIAGFIDHKIQKEDQQPLLDRMLTSIAHRGPDARGMYFNNEVALGHNRLSIIDLSEQGNQPMHYGKYSIVYNGEIYNYLEIRKELEKLGCEFKTSSDTEVILIAYAQWGKGCVAKFIGMWSLVILDNETGQVFASRDRFGIKPFYYISENGAFYFASEYKALKNTPYFTGRINLEQVNKGLKLGWTTYQDQAFLNCIKQLPASSNLFISEGKINIENYWTLSDTNIDTGNPNEISTRFRALLEDAVSIHMRSDVEVAVALSGGIDSSSLVSIINHLYPSQKVHTFSIYYDGPGEVDERPYINEVNNKFSNTIPHLYRPDILDAEELFHKVLDISDVPITGSSPMSHYYLVEKIKAAGIKVILDGQGADEYLAGYNTAYYRLLADSLRNVNFAELTDIIKGMNRHVDFKGRMTSSILKGVLSVLKDESALIDFEYKNYYSNLLKEKYIKTNSLHSTEFSKNRLNSYLYNTLFITSLPTILHFVDRMTMAHSVESRVPFLDHRLVEFGFSLNSNLKIQGAETKSILRNSVKDILPPKIFERRDKKGFVTPGENKWLRGPLKWLLDFKPEEYDFLDPNECNKLIKEYNAGSNKNAKLVWRLAVLIDWIKRNNYNVN